jgi:hypothetical protein
MDLYALRISAQSTQLFCRTAHLDSVCHDAETVYVREEGVYTAHQQPWRAYFAFLGSNRVLDRVDSDLTLARHSIHLFYSHSTSLYSKWQSSL